MQGDSAALSIQRGIRATMNGGGGHRNAFTSLSHIGVAFQKDGSLALDATKLQTAMDSGFDQIAGLFAMRARATDSLISYGGAAARQQPETIRGVTQLATRAASPEARRQD